MALSDELDAYAVYVNAVIAHPEDEELWEDLAKAKRAVEVAYLEHQLAAGEDKPASGAEERHGANSRPNLNPEPPETIGYTTSTSPDGW